MPRPPKKGWKPKFLKALRYIPNIARACRLALISQQSAYDNYKKDKRFAAQWDEALETGFSLLEERSQKLALNGTKRGVWKTDKEGNPVKVEIITEYSVPMMQFMLRSHYAKYRDQQTVAHIGGGEGSAPIVTQAMPPILSKMLEEDV